MAEREQGSVLVLVIGLTVVLLALVGVVVNVSVAVLDKRSLAGAADGAAVSAAQGLDYEAFYARGPAGGVPLSAADVQDRVAQYQAQAAADQPGLALSGEVEGVGTAVVTATRTVRLPFAGWVGVGPVTLTAVARARAPLVVP